MAFDETRARSIERLESEAQGHETCLYDAGRWQALEGAVRLAASCAGTLGSLLRAVKSRRAYANNELLRLRERLGQHDRMTAREQLLCGKIDGLDRALEILGEEESNDNEGEG